MSGIRQWHLLRRVIIGLDVGIIAIAPVLLMMARRDQVRVCRLWCGGWSVPNELLYSAFWLLMLASARLYDDEKLIEGFQQYARLAQAAGYVLLLLGLLVLVFGDTLAARHWLLEVFVLTTLLLLIERVLAQTQIQRLRRRGILRGRVLIVGAGADGVDIAEQLIARSKGTRILLGFLDEYRAIGTKIGTSEVLGEPLALRGIAQRLGATEAIIVAQAISWESLQILLHGEPHEWGLQRLWLAPAFRDLLTTGMEVREHGSLPLISVSRPRINGLAAVFKRGLDIGLSLLVLPIVLPLCLGIAAWLALIRHRAPFERHPVVGRNRREVVLYSFPRLPLLLRCHVWRLPALVNVLRGQMSLVGPRPISHSQSGEYQHWRMMLTSVRPGLTGHWWLVSGSSSRALEMEVPGDLAYIRNYTIWSDLRLLGLTAYRLAIGLRREARAGISTQRDTSQPAVAIGARKEGL